MVVCIGCARRAGEVRWWYVYKKVIKIYRYFIFTHVLVPVAVVHRYNRKHRKVLLDFVVHKLVLYNNVV